MFREIEVSLKSDKNNGYFKRIPIYYLDNISLIFLDENFFGQTCTENQNVYFIFINIFFPKIVPFKR